MNAVVEKLTVAASGRVLEHLRQLPPEDRALRFGPAANDAAIERYVAAIDFARDSVFGLSEADESLAGVAHLALERGAGTAALGLSVVPHRRGCGYGYALLNIAGDFAARLGCRRLYLDNLPDNRVLIHLARKAGMTVVHRQSGDEPHLALPPRFDPRPARRFSALEWLAVMRGVWRASQQT